MEKEEILSAWFVFNSGQVLIEKQTDGYHIPYSTEPPVPVPVGSTIHLLGELNGHPAKAYAIYMPVTGNEQSPRMMKDLRASYDVLPLEEYKWAGKASQILNWDKNSRYCPMCGVPTIQISPIAKQCPECRQEIYPRISPAVIVLIQKGESILLVHARNFRGSYKGLVAGFLEPGRDTGGMCEPGSNGRNRTDHQESEIFRKSALAISQWHYDRLYSRIRKRYHQAAGRRAQCRSLLYPGAPARNSQETKYRPKND